MPSQIHGKKRLFQILCDPHRAELIETLAKKEGKKPNAWVRETLYEVLKDRIPEDIYRVACEKDDRLWQQSVKNRVEGRMKNKQS